MKIRELQEMVESDSILDITSLDQHSLETAKLQSKYFVLYSQILGEYKVLEHDLNDLKQLKFRYYRGLAEPEVYKAKPLHEKISTNTLAQTYVEADQDVQKELKRMDVMNIKLELIKDMKKSLEGRNWQIRNAIDFVKFKNGM